MSMTTDLFGAGKATFKVGAMFFLALADVWLIWMLPEAASLSPRKQGARLGASASLS